MANWLLQIHNGQSVETESTGPDEFPIPLDSQLQTEHKYISSLLASGVFEKSMERHDLGWPKLCEDILRSYTGDDHAALVTAWIERALASELQLNGKPLESISNFVFWRGLDELISQALTSIPQEIRGPLLQYATVTDSLYKIERSLKRVVSSFRKLEPTPSELEDLKTFYFNLLNCDGEYSITKNVFPYVKDDPDSALCVFDVWAESAVQMLHSLKPKEMQAWLSLFHLCSELKKPTPEESWKRQVSALVQKIGEAVFKSRVLNWLDLAKQPRTEEVRRRFGGSISPSNQMHSRNADALRGLLWALAPLVDEQTLRAIREMTIHCYGKEPGIGPRAVKVGNATVAVLGEVGTIEAVAQLAIIKAKVKFKTAQKLIEKALVATAHKAGVPRDELEEMAVPEYGLTEVGKRIEQFGDYRCEQVIENGKVDLRWFKPDGKQQKSVPAFVKENHAHDLKELKDAGKDIAKLLPAQSARIDGSYLTEKVWDFDIWAERYLNHPLVATVARRLIWQVDGKSAMPTDGVLRDADGKEVKTKKKSKVKLWHPLFVDDAEVQAWRGYLFDNQIKQPFKQAYREIYRLTDAEVNTGNYSNRFAAHIIKQHQFNALVATRGWSHTLRMMVDDEYKPAYIDLPHWNMRAEYWVEGVGDEYGEDTTEAGAYLRLVTDQVRFYRMDSGFNWAHAGGGGYTLHGEEAAVNEPLLLSEIPELLFSEIFRDVDLFVGVASVGADPLWADGGAEGRYIDYWQNYSFGDLSETAKTRRELLERLIPMLKIADKCELTDKWLKVTGSIRTYKIHLGSGNILMEPNDEYLCIVANASMGKAAGKVFLPFEGDRTMAVILSKAFLLADDKKIKDRTILSQIKRGM